VLGGIVRTFFFEFRNSLVFIVWKFFGNIQSFQTRKNFANSSEISLEIFSCFWVKKPCFGVKKPCFGVKKFGEKFRKVRKQRFLNIWNLQKIQNLFYSELSEKLQKNDVKIKFWKSQKTRSDSKTNSNAQFEVCNAGSYLTHCCLNS